MADDLDDDWWMSNGDGDLKEAGAAAGTEKKKKKKSKDLEFTKLEKVDGSDDERPTKKKNKHKAKSGQENSETSSPEIEKHSDKQTKRKAGVIENENTIQEPSKSKKKKLSEYLKENGAKPKKKKQKTPESSETVVKKAKKRKATETDHIDEDDDLKDDEAVKEKSGEKKKKKRRRITDALAKAEQKPLSHTELTDAISKHLGSKLSAIEKDEISISAENFHPCRNESESPSEYLQTVLPRWNKRVKAMDESKGAPLLIVICSAATRAVDLIRELKKFHFGKCKVAKLFAKHMKIQQQKKFLKKDVIHIGVGTPNRIAGLLSEDALTLKQTVMILMDWSWRNAKYGRLIDIKDHRKDFMDLLQKFLVPRVKTGKCKFGLM